MMSPEKTMSGSQILPQAERIASHLLAIQSESLIAAERIENNLIEGLRDELGYAEPEVVDENVLIDRRIESKTPVIAPGPLARLLGRTARSIETVQESRDAIEDILAGEDDRLLAIVGPCSIHDPDSALVYAEQVAQWRAAYGDDIEIVMRAYMEKPRTELGWKGFVYDPKHDETDDINVGLVAQRILACQITDAGVPIAMERLNALTPQYVNGLVSYDAIGARNTTDQKAREYASGTSSPVGFKNTPDGSINAARSAVISANGPHSFLGMGMNGTPHQIKAVGNETAHVILRGDNSGSNFSPTDIAYTKEKLREKNLLMAIIVDASHNNKVEGRQQDCIDDVSQQICLGEYAIKGVMIESNLIEGKQKDTREDGQLIPVAELKYGLSITDECVGLEETELMLSQLAAAVQRRRELTIT